ncbi:AI-2E family transporter [Carbonactinospora thermoautotrophica]|uniref:AI-2E family transporter n=1 Tax=Carbonactinospora thermoautotrophica TaxID=1469144 RepID=A0A132MNE0_9ACTN|nr:AI-2E family transporter [Carbonactinospora thermoautotrophica]KWW99368.1 Uncharacterized protein LI90_1003 [Carbonactinospora thermoautotrophica]MCX9192509.1 AI-2E family transporter [Carbonactinospora thermoautotrophica]
MGFWSRLRRTWQTVRDNSPEAAAVEQPGAAQVATSRRALDQTALRDTEHDPHPVPRPVRAAAAWSWRLLVIGAAIAVLLNLLGRFAILVFPVVIALFVATLLRPATVRLTGWGMPRGVAATIVFVSGFLILALALTALVTTLAAGLQDISQNLADAVQKIRGWLQAGPLKLSDRDFGQLWESLQRSLAQNRDKIASGALSTATVVGEVGAGFLLTLFATFFFIYDGEKIWAWIVRLFPRRVERDVDEAGRLAWQALTAIVRGTVIVAAVDAIAITILLLILKVPLAVPLGILIFFGAFIPIIGSVLAGTVAVLVALVVKGVVTALIVLAGLVVVMQLEGHVLQPLIMGKLVKLHPLAIVLAVSAGTLVAGIGGALVAVPIVAALNVSIQYFARLSERAEPREAVVESEAAEIPHADGRREASRPEIS